MKHLMLSLLVLLLPVGAGAQDSLCITPRHGKAIENGVGQAPATALRALMEVATVDPRYGQLAAAAVLRKQFDTRPATELDAFVGDLLRLMRDGTKWQETKASIVLTSAAASFENADLGNPYTRAKDVFVRLYESFEDRTSQKVSRALYGVFNTGGVDYVRDLFKASEKPPPCFQPHSTLPPGVAPPPEEEWCPNKSVWCQAGNVLLYGGRDGPDPAAPDPAVWTPLCYRYRWLPASRHNALVPLNYRGVEALEVIHVGASATQAGLPAVRPVRGLKPLARRVRVAGCRWLLQCHPLAG